MPKAIKRKAPELKLAKSLNWDRSGSVVKKIGVCDSCHQEAKTCLAFDTSAEEYGEIVLCKDCLNSMFD